MAKFTSKITFEITGLNKEDIKSSKSTVEKTYFSRLERELKQHSGYLSEYKEKLEDVQTLSNSSFRRKWEFEYCHYQIESCDDDTTKKILIEKYKKKIDGYNSDINELQKRLDGSMPEDYWLLWFAFDLQAVKAFGKVAHDLFNLISDGKDHDIEGEMVNNGASVEIISFKEKNN